MAEKKEYLVRHPPKLPPVSPGEVLSEEVLPAMGLSVSAAARRMGISRQTLHRILSGAQGVTPEMALRIGKFCGNGPDLWSGLQLEYDLWHAERRMKSALARIEPYVAKPARRKKSA